MDFDEILPSGGFRDGHIHALVRLLKRLDDFPSRKTSDGGVILATWLFHLAGGHDAGLLLPSREKTKATKALYSRADTRSAAYKSKLQSLDSEARRPNASVATAKRLNDHRALAAERDLFDACIQHLRPSANQAAGKAAGKAAAAAAPPAPPPASPAEAELRRRAACCTALAMGTHARLGLQSRDDLRGHDDVFRLIAEHAELRTSDWLATPLPKEVPTLRRQHFLEYRLRRAADARAEQLRVENEQLRTENVRLVRQTESAVQGRERERAAGEERVQEVREGAAAWQEAAARAMEAQEKEKLREGLQRLREELRWVTKQWMGAKEELRREREEAEPERRRVQDAEMRDERRRLAAEREEKAAEAAELAEQVENLQLQLQQLQVALERVRETSKAGLLQQVAELQQKVRELGARRKANQLKVRDANLARQATKVAQEKLSQERATLRDFWGEGLDLAARSRELKTENARLVEKLVGTQRELEAQLKETEKLKAIAEPPKSKFFEAGHFSAAVDQVIIELLCCGVARNKVNAAPSPARTLSCAASRVGPLGPRSREVFSTSARVCQITKPPARSLSRSPPLTVPLRCALARSCHRRS